MSLIDAPHVHSADVDLLDDARWDALMAGRDASLFSSRRWMRVLHDVYGFEFRGRLLIRAETPVAGVAYSQIDDPRGRRVVSLPFCDVNDPVVDTHDAWLQLTDDLFDAGIPLVFRTRDNPVLSADRRLTSEWSGVWHELDATVDPETSMAAFATLPRRMIRRAGREGLVVGRSTARTDLRAFYGLHVTVRKYRHRLLAQPFELFEKIADEYLERGDGVLIGAWHGHRFAGGCLVLVHGDTAFFKFSASDPDFRQAGVSHATLFEGLRYAHEKGLRAYDLGRSDLDPPGLVDFKRRFRPRERPLVTHRHLPSNRPVDRLGASLGALTSLLVRDDVPDAVTEEAGRLLYRYFA